MNNNNYLKTEVISDEINRCEDIEDYKNEILPLIKSQKEQWVGKISEILKETGYTKSKFAELCDVSRMSVDKWCKGAIPKNRETFLKIGMAAHYNLEHMNQLLKRYGRYPELYSKSLEDLVCIFVINKGYGEKSFEKYKYILNKIKEKGFENIDSDAEAVSTEKFVIKLSEVKDEDELEDFIAGNIQNFNSTYHKFYAYVNMWINANYQDCLGSVNQLADSQEWSSSLRQCVSAIRQNKWYPTRNKIISLGLHLSMEHKDIDRMLELAHMEPLCAKNIFESVIIYILEYASINGVLNQESDNYDPDELCALARKILEQLNLPEFEDFINELPEVDDAW